MYMSFMLFLDNKKKITNLLNLEKREGNIIIIDEERTWKWLSCTENCEVKYSIIILFGFVFLQINVGYKTLSKIYLREREGRNFFFVYLTKGSGCTKNY